MYRVFQVYPKNDITNIVESSHYVKIGNWCKMGYNKCKHTDWVKPYRCLGKCVRGGLFYRQKSSTGTGLNCCRFPSAIVPASHWNPTSPPPIIPDPLLPLAIPPFLHVSLRAASFTALVLPSFPWLITPLPLPRHRFFLSLLTITPGVFRRAYRSRQNLFGKTVTAVGLLNRRRIKKMLKKTSTRRFIIIRTKGQTRHWRRTSYRK